MEAPGLAPTPDAPPGPPDPAPPRHAPVASARHTWTILAVLVFVTWASASAFRTEVKQQSPPSHTTSYVLLIATEWLLAFGAWRGLKATETPLRDILGRGSERGAPLLRSLVLGLAVLPVVRVLAYLLGRGLAHFFGANAETGSAYVTAAIAPHGLIEQVLWVALSFSAGICEEFVYRGYLQRQFTAWLGGPLQGIAASAIVFGLTHAYQGGWQVVVITLGFGLPLGLFAYAVRGLAPGMFAHALQDTLAGLRVA